MSIRIQAWQCRQVNSRFQSNIHSTPTQIERAHPYIFTEFGSRCRKCALTLLFYHERTIRLRVPEDLGLVVAERPGRQPIKAKLCQTNQTVRVDAIGVDEYSNMMLQEKNVTATQRCIIIKIVMSWERTYTSAYRSRYGSTRSCATTARRLSCRFEAAPLTYLNVQITSTRAMTMHLTAHASLHIDHNFPFADTTRI